LDNILQIAPPLCSSEYFSIP